MEDNKLFILLANILHEGQGVSEDLKHVVDDIRTHCATDPDIQKIEQKIMEKFENISAEPIYADEITEESLEIANSITFAINFCSSEVQFLKFYQELFENFSLETVLKALARIITLTKEKKLVQYYNTAKKLLDKTTRMMKLRNKDIAVLTTAVSELDLYPDLRNHQVNKGKDHLSNLGKKDFVWVKQKALTWISLDVLAFAEVKLNEPFPTRKSVCQTLKG